MGIRRNTTGRLQQTVRAEIENAVSDRFLFNPSFFPFLICLNKIKCNQRYSLAKIGARALQRVHNTSYLIGSVPDLLALASGNRLHQVKPKAKIDFLPSIT